MVLRVEDFASEEFLDELEIADPLELTGLYDGVPMTENPTNRAAARHSPIRSGCSAAPSRDEWAARAATGRWTALVGHVVIRGFAHHFRLVRRRYRRHRQVVGVMDQAPILTITLNPALDISTSAARVVPDVKLRCEAPSFDPGGGGINVSRAIRNMGGHSTALVALGGTTGQRMAAMPRATSIPVLSLPPGRDAAIPDRRRPRHPPAIPLCHAGAGMVGGRWPALELATEMAPGDGLVVLFGVEPARRARQLLAPCWPGGCQGQGTRRSSTPQGGRWPRSPPRATGVFPAHGRREEAEGWPAALPYRADTAAFAAPCRLGGGAGG